MSFKIAYAPQVASLASQHHASDYYRAKYGPKGYPVPYVPFSVNLPDQFRDLRRRQESYGLSSTTSWWTCDASMSTADGEQVLAVSESTNIGSIIELEQELSAAMDSPLQSNAHTAAPRSELNTCKPPIKTSSTHPLNVSCIIPSELIALISSHFVVASPSNSVPVLLELPPQFYLDRLVSHPPCHALDQAQTSMGPPNHQIAPSRLPVTSPVPVYHTQSASRPKMHARTRSSMSQAMQAAINTSLAIFSAEKPAINCRPPLSPIPDRRSPRRSSFLFQRANDSALSLALSVSFKAKSTSNLNEGMEENSNIKNPQVCSPECPEDNASGTDCGTETAAAAIPATPKVHTPTPTPSLTRTSSLGDESVSSPFLLGNMYMSSCPGKKVRLHGPLRGRSGICRDLDADLQRIRALGVKCIVCCLDDSELEYLGAPWPEYRAAAMLLGIDILRIPIPEGLAPLDTASLDGQITELIGRYTVNGIPTLVHCRGGVGRAGVVACCWIAKLGLCGWLEDSGIDANSSPTLIRPLTDGYDAGVRWDTVSFAKKIITLVRRRRSMKAIETYEQARFLVDYVEYLRQGHGVRIGQSA
ncbi:hypothetical protein PTI98_006371 [Pleurotus ostreatus]|nr:hypothetical protein PTI98_006371 [Pleurotus ostreatus]